MEKDSVDILVVQEEVEMVRNLASELSKPLSLNSLLLLLNTGSSLLFMFDGIFTLIGFDKISLVEKKNKTKD